MEGSQYDTKICRICLRTDSTLYSMRPYNKAYGDLTGLQINSIDNLPPYLCSECAVKLLNSVHFKTTSLQAHSLLVDIINSHGHVNVKLIQSKRKEQNQLDLESECDTSEEVGIKKENSYTEDIYQDVIEGGIDNDTINQDTVTDGDAINSDVMSPDIKEDMITSNSSEEVAAYVVKSENDMNQDSSNENTEWEHKYVVVSEDCCLEDPLADPKQTGNPSNPGIEDSRQAELVTHHNLGDDSGLQVNDKLSCDICHYQTNSDLVLLTHLKTHAASEHRCNECSYCTANKHSLIRHLKIHSEEKRHSCSVCSRVFRRKCDLVVHLKTHSGQTDSCDVCQKKFAMKSMLAKHKRTHSGERPYICDICNKEFSLKCTLAKHLKTHKVYSCDQCNKSFTKKYTLARHLRQGHLRTHSQKFHVGSHMKTHSQHKQYNRLYFDKPTILNHFKIHTNVNTNNVNTYACNVCNKLFNCKSNLTKHFRVHSGDKPFQCSVCNEAFRHRVTLTNHLRTHSGEKPYSCTVCHKSFAQIAHVRSHMKIHSGEKPYSCDICNKKFSQKSHLKVHQRTHFDEKPFQCNLCDKAFKYQSTLSKHFRKHSDE